MYPTISPIYKMNYDMWNYLTVLTVEVVTCYFLSFYQTECSEIFNYSSEKVTTHSLILSYSVT